MRIAWIVAGVYMAIHSALAVYRWHILMIGSDNGIFAQAILTAGRGFSDGPEGGSHFHFHFSPIIAVLYPLVALTHSALALQFAQIALFALTAPAIYVLFKPYMSAGVCARLSALALLYAPIGALGLDDFHEVAFFPVMAILMLRAADRARWGWFAVFASACILTREDVGIELALIGMATAGWVWRRRQRTTGEGLLLGEPRDLRAVALAFGALSATSALTTIAYFRTVAAVFGSWVPGQDYDYPMSHGPLGLVSAFVTKPLVAIPAVFHYGKVGYLLEGLLPLMLLPLRSPWSLLAVPSFVIILLASNSFLWHMGSHYSAMWGPWLLIGTGAALAHMERRRGLRLATHWANAAIAGCIVVLLAFNPMHLRYNLRPAYADLASERAALACVPRGASLDTHDQWFAQIAADNPASSLNTAGADYLVYALDSNDYFPQWNALTVAQSVRAGRYVPVCRFGNVVTYRHPNPGAAYGSQQQITEARLGWGLKKSGF